MKYVSPFKTSLGGHVTLRELSLHLLDILENAVRAKATIIRVTILLDKASSMLVLRVEDDGPGMDLSAGQVLNPFYTTKKGKRTGLGLSLFQAAALQAGGELALDRSELGGLKVEASFLYAHVDRAPLGNIGDTIKTLAVTNPETVWICQIDGPGGAHTLILQDIMEDDPDVSLFAVTEKFGKQIDAALTEACISVS